MANPTNSIADLQAQSEQMLDEYRSRLARGERLERPTGKKVPGRNEACWCGSGKKYKKCHWLGDQNQPSGQVKVSDILHALCLAAAPPGARLPEDLEGRQRLVSLALAAWNVSRMPPELRAEPMQELSEVIGSAMVEGHPEAEEGRAALISLVQHLVAIALERWPDDRRMVLNAEVLEHAPGEFHIVASSAVPES